ncbi:F-box protein At5g07610-like [Bidens hawaiensis]|uniref:F-box protein At5g07610-like n=1 Tax=Bidens hawaiensis TaxID=980011 RepID=UPI00404A6B94
MEDSDNHSGALIVGSIDDLLTEILIRLPVTSILRFKSVSKRWRLLLSHKNFTHRYDNNNNNLSKSVGLIGDYDVYVPFDVENRSPPPFRSLEFYFNRSNVIIEHSCNGLLLCSTVYNGALEYYVFNPTTKQLAFIPSVPKNIRSMALAFHQNNCVHFKVVCVCTLETSGRLFQIQVYSSDTGKWKICIESFSTMISEFCYTVYWNGAIHWAPDSQSGSKFLYFKLDDEQLQMLPMPPKELVSDEVFTMYFGESRGHLHLISSHAHPEDRILILDVYEMPRDHSGWFVKYKLQLDELPDFPVMFDYVSGVVDVVRGKKEEETFLVLVTPEKMMRYNVHDKSFNELYSQTNYGLYHETSSCHRYIVALSSF